MKHTTSELLATYQKRYRKLRATSASVKMTSKLWDTWEKGGMERPKIEEVVAGIPEREKRFFQELVIQCARFAEKPEGVIEQCALELYDYNFRKISATDGCIILTDEAFERMLFVLALGSLHIARETAPKAELQELKHWLRTVVQDWFLGLKEFPIPTGGMERFLAGDYETSEMGVFLFNAMHAFCLAHEIGHHALGHTSSETLFMLPSERFAHEIEVDAQSHEEEFLADDYARRVYANLHLIKDGRNPLCFVWWYEFAPLLLMDIFALIEEARGGNMNSQTHPPPNERKEKLLSLGDLQRSDPLYLDLREAVSSVII